MSVDIQKWFPIGSKGRQKKPIRMVAQQIKTIDFAADIDFSKMPNPNSVTGLLHPDKFSNKISDLVRQPELSEQPVYVLNSTL